MSRHPSCERALIISILKKELNIFNRSTQIKCRSVFPGSSTRRSCTGGTKDIWRERSIRTNTITNAQIGAREAVVAAPTCTPAMISHQTSCLPANTCHLYAAPPARRRSAIWKRPPAPSTLPDRCPCLHAPIWKHT